jgi:hypothetical protein
MSGEDGRFHDKIKTVSGDVKHEREYITDHRFDLVQATGLRVAAFDPWDLDKPPSAGLAATAGRISRSLPHRHHFSPNSRCKSLRILSTTPSVNSRCRGMGIVVSPQRQSSCSEPWRARLQGFFVALACSEILRIRVARFTQLG